MPDISQKQAEREFFASLNHLCALYEWVLPDVSGLPYPRNMETAYRELRSRMTAAHDFDCLILQDSRHAATLATVKTFGTGYQLYYIPVKPLYTLARQAGAKPVAKLLTFIYTYLYKVAGVDYFRNPGFLNNCYEEIDNWIDENEWDEDNEAVRQKQKQEMALLKSAGDAIFKTISKPFHLQKLEKARRFYAKTAAPDTALLAVAEEFVKLAADYPARSILDGIPRRYYQSGDNDLIYLDNVLSFYWSANDCFYDSLMETVNNDLQECSREAAPLAVQWFDRPQAAESHSFDFERRLFSLLVALIDVLEPYDHD